MEARLEVTKRVDVPPSRVNVVRGEKSREKLVLVDGIEQAKVEAALEGL